MKVSLVLGIRFEQDPQDRSRVGKVTFLENKYSQALENMKKAFMRNIQEKRFSL